MCAIFFSLQCLKMIWLNKADSVVSVKLIILKHHEGSVLPLYFHYWMALFFTGGQFWPSGIVVVCVCVCLHVCVGLCLRAITRDPFKLGSPNLDHRGKTIWLRSLLFCGAIDLDIQDEISGPSPNLPHFQLVRTITHHPFKLGSPN